MEKLLFSGKAIKLKRIASLCTVVVFGASTAIYAGNTSETDKVEMKVITDL